LFACNSLKIEKKKNVGEKYLRGHCLKNIFERIKTTHHILNVPHHHLTQLNSHEFGRIILFKNVPHHIFGQKKEVSYRHIHSDHIYKQPFFFGLITVLAS